METTEIPSRYLSWANEYTKWQDLCANIECFKVGVIVGCLLGWTVIEMP